MLPQSWVKVTNDAQLYLLNAFHATLNWVSDRSEYLISSNCSHRCILVKPIPILVKRALTIKFQIIPPEFIWVKSWTIIIFLSFSLSKHEFSFPISSPWAAMLKFQYFTSINQYQYCTTVCMGNFYFGNGVTGKQKSQ